MTGSQRIDSITSNTNLVFNIDDNPNADSSYGAWRNIESLGIKAVNEYSSIIEQQAKVKGVDPNLVKAIVYIENAQGYHDNIATTLLGWAGFEQKSIKPMNLRDDVWLGLAQSMGYSQQDFQDPAINITIGVELIKRIQDRLAPEDRTPDKIYTLYNNTNDAVNKVSDIGARLNSIYNQESWTRGYDIINDSWSKVRDQYEQIIDNQISLGIYAADQKPQLMQNGENAFSNLTILKICKKGVEVFN